MELKYKAINTFQLEGKTYKRGRFYSEILKGCEGMFVVIEEKTETAEAPKQENRKRKRK